MKRNDHRCWGGRIIGAMALAVLLGAGAAAVGDEVIPAKPDHYFNDYAGVVPAATATQLDARQEKFDRETTNQFVVAVFKKMQSDDTIENYTLRVANAWGVGQKGKNNGVVLFVFTQDHKMYLQVGKGLEAVLPNVECKRIIEELIAPKFKAGDFAGGLTAGVTAVIEATRRGDQGKGQSAGGAAAGSGGGPSGDAGAAIPGAGIFPPGPEAGRHDYIQQQQPAAAEQTPQVPAVPMGFPQGVVLPGNAYGVGENGLSSSPVSGPVVLIVVFVVFVFILCAVVGGLPRGSYYSSRGYNSTYLWWEMTHNAGQMNHPNQAAGSGQSGIDVFNGFGSSGGGIGSSGSGGGDFSGGGGGFSSGGGGGGSW